MVVCEEREREIMRGLTARGSCANDICNLSNCLLRSHELLNYGNWRYIQPGVRSHWAYSLQNRKLDKQIAFSLATLIVSS